MKHFLIASILAMAITQLNVTVDGVIVSHWIGPDALSAVNLYSPVSLAITSLITLFGMGATILASRSIGERDYKRVEKLLSTALTSVAFVGVLVGVLSFVFKDSLVSLICTEVRLEHYFSEYVQVMVVCCVVTMISTLLNQMICIDGNPEYITKVVLASSISNVVFDLLFVGWFGWGITGAATATICSSAINVILLLLYIYGKKFSFRLRPIRSFKLSILKENLLQGIPLIVSNMVLMLMFFFLNVIIQEKQGADGMYAWSICLNLLMLGMMFSSGIASAVLSIGGFLNGQYDFAGLRLLISRSIWLLEGLLILLVLVIEIHPGLITGLFGANSPELIEYANSCLRVFAWILPCVLLILLMANIYQMLGYLMLTPIVVLMFPLILIPSMLAWGNISGEDDVWYAFPQTGVCLVVLCFIVSQIQRMRTKGLQVFTLVPLRAIKDSYSQSVKVETESLKESLSGIAQYLSSIEMDKQLVNNINLCIEEVMLNVVQYANRNKQTVYFDVHICLVDNTILASVKDAGRAFNPIFVSEEEKGSGLKLLHGLCKNVDYKYMYGQNMTFMKWNINHLNK